MSFIGGSKETFEFTLTPLGKRTLAQNGLVSEKLYYTFFDDEVIYTLNAYPNLIPDINGIENKISDTINFKYNLK